VLGLLLGHLDDSIGTVRKCFVVTGKHRRWRERPAEFRASEDAYELLARRFVISGLSVNDLTLRGPRAVLFSRQVMAVGIHQVESFVSML
jgi:hypothetical protein